MAFLHADVLISSLSMSELVLLSAVEGSLFLFLLNFLTRQVFLLIASSHIASYLDELRGIVRR